MTVLDLAPADRLPVPGTYNFREVAPAGIRRGRLFRSDAIDRLGESGRSELAAQGIRLVVDLRTDDEAARQPDDLDGCGIDLVRAPLFTGSVASMIPQDLDLAATYRLMVDGAAPAIAAALGAIAEASGGVLVHCTAGKDRTGVVVALALAVAGVDREAIVADYGRSEELLAGEWSEAMLARVAAHGVEPTPQLVELMTRSPEGAIRGVFATIDAEHGGLEAYLDAAGFDEAARERLRTALQEEAR